LHVISNIHETQSQCEEWRNQGHSIAFVPTMGSLHEGHLSLVEKACALADRVVVSIFVNPLQFDDPADLLKYPVSLEADIQKLSCFDVDLVFTPVAAEFYTEGVNSVEKVSVGKLGDILEGEMRPGHFVGVATVVKRLFQLVNPHYAVFGEKDFQQLLVIKQLVEQFNLNIEIVPMPTSREPGGLAMSSRNVRLSAAERAIAAEIYNNLRLVRSLLLAGEEDWNKLECIMIENLTRKGFAPEYVVIRDALSLEPVKDTKNQKVILAAARLGSIRLIDNLRV